MLWLCAATYFSGLAPFHDDRLSIAGATWMIVSLLAGFALIVHGRASLDQRASKPLAFPPILTSIAAFLLAILLLILAAPGHRRHGVPMLIPFTLIVAGALPPLASVTWFARSGLGRISWRRGTVSVVAGAVVGVLPAALVEVVLSLTVLGVVGVLGDPILAEVETLIDLLAGGRIAAVLSDPSFVILAADAALIAPAVEELIKPLIIIPLISRLEHRDAFLIGALAGAGFAALENVIYGVGGLEMAPGLLALRGLGGAIHPLATGLVAWGWWEVLRSEVDAWRHWTQRFAAAVGLHTLWNGGSLLVIALAGAEFFGPSPPEIAIADSSTTTVLLALLCLLGLAALAVGRIVATQGGTEPRRQRILTDRTLAIWAVACLLVLVPIGIAVMRVLPT
jgi:RsiW-degrading membrane proteinase PrsW (M82 family)